ncbi:MULTISPECIES: hypothetical protein [unclassified Streptomyces]|uniref:hypothetical protein n=1 Tax=unclassified Streptomyces TaxID=2593676 RepID=UPI0037008BBE
MTAGRRHRTARFPPRATRFPSRAAAVLAALAAVLLTLGSGGDARPVPAAVHLSASLSPTAYSSDTRPYGDDAYAGARTPLVRPERDAGGPRVPAGPLFLAAAHTPPVPPRPARPAPAAGHAPPAAAHVPADLGRAPPAPSST